MTQVNTPQLRAFIAGCITVAAAVCITETLASSKTANFNEITVGRINIVEPDGTKRLIIASRAQFPGSFYRGKEFARPDRRNDAGLLFVNDEGTENGGLVQSGWLGKDGKVQAGLSLTFDRFRQDQALHLEHDDDGANSTSYVGINDVPDSAVISVEEELKTTEKMTAEQKRAYVKKLVDDGKVSHNRVYLGTTDDHAASLVLKDAKGKPRLRLAVAENGDAVVEMLDENGQVVKKMTPGL